MEADDEIIEIDGGDETALRVWWEVREAASAERPPDSWPTWEVSRAELPAPDPERQQKLFGAYLDGEMVGAVPAEWVADYCELLSTFMSQIPLGDLDLSDSEWTPQRQRATEQRNPDVGLVSYGSLALSADGSVVGCSDVNISGVAARAADIGITVVAPEHRGHRLGLALKLANHHAVREHRPECLRVRTSNAGVNDHMNAVNEQMGYRAVETLHEMQRVL